MNKNVKKKERKEKLFGIAKDNLRIVTGGGGVIIEIATDRERDGGVIIE